MAEAETTDAELMLAYASGDQAAFARLYQRHRGPLYRYFRRQLPPDQADDCFQALWLKVIGHASRYRPTGAFQHYLFSLAHNVLMDHYRNQQRRPTEPEPDDAGAAELADGAPGPDGIAAERELRERLLVLIQRLPVPQREAWILRQEAALPVEAIAAITHTSIEGVRSRLRYATHKLRAGLARYV